MKKRAKRLLISAVAALLLTAGLLYLATRPSTGPNLFTLSVLPFWMIGSFFSGSIHAPAEAPAYLSMYLFFFMVVYVSLFAWSKMGEKDDA
jgi:hypothetical protein